jgi:aryl sulfotransferase
MTGEGLHILQNGVPRSGNVWLARLIRDLLSAAGIPLRQHLDGHPVSAALADSDLGIEGVQHADFIHIQPLRSFYTILENFRWPIDDLDAYIASSA